MRLTFCVLLACISACSHKRDAPAAQGSATPLAAPTGSGSQTPANPAPATPNMTAERFFREQYSSFLQPTRGVWFADGDSGPEHLCGNAIGTAMVRIGTMAGKLEDSAGPDDCKVDGAYTYCTFGRPGADPKTDPDSSAAYVFSRDEPPVLLAVWIGTAAARAKQLERELAVPRECKRPSE